MSTAFHQIVQGIIDALLVSPAIASGHVDRPRRHPVPAEWASHVEVRLARADGEWPYVGPNTPGQWTSAIAVDCYARANPGDQPDATLDALLDAVATRVRAITLSGLGVIDVMPSLAIDWDWAEGATPQALASLQLVVKHDTRSAGLAP